MNEQTRLVDVPASQRFMKFDKIDWNKAFFKTYYERRSFLHLLVNFNRIWVLHISCFWFYTAYNSPTIYTLPGASAPNNALRWSAVALGGAVASLIMLAATLAEFSYVPTTWNNTSHLLNRFMFLLVILAATAGPTIYIAFYDQISNTALILSYVQFAVSAFVVLFFSIVPSGRLFGDRVAGKARKYLANQTFTASYPSLDSRARLASIGLWILVFGCKLTESYFFLTLSFKNPIVVMVGMRVQNCSDKIFGNALCQYQPAFALAIMFCMDLCLFFLDTFLWYVIWNTGEFLFFRAGLCFSFHSLIFFLLLLFISVFSVVRSFAIGLSIWTPWKGELCGFSDAVEAEKCADPQIFSSDCRSECMRRSWLRRRWKSSISQRYSSRKCGTRLLSQCIVNICCRSITFNDYCIIKFLPSKMGNGCCELRCFSFLRTIR